MDPVALLAGIFSNSAPDEARKQYLRYLRSRSGASLALLFLTGDAPDVVQRVLADEETGGIEQYQRFVEQWARSTENETHLENDLLPLQLSYQDRPLGVILLVFEDAFPDPSFLNLLPHLRALLSFFEQHQKLKMLLGVTKENLTSLSLESASIADSNNRLFRQLVANENRLRSISKGVLRMQEEERSKISRELHDGIGQALTALKIQVDFLNRQMGNEFSPEAFERMKEIQALSEQCLEEVRELSRLLRPRMLDELGLFPTLSWYVKRFSEHTGINVSLALDELDQRLDNEIETMLFRITQEALNNVAKHSQSKTASVNLICSKDLILLEIADRGIGLDPSRSARAQAEFSSGLAGIRERVSLCGGKFSISSQPGLGTRLNIRIPLKKQKTIQRGERRARREKQ